MNKKLFIVGLDGATWTVLNLLMDRGAMPFLRKFLNEGSSGILMSTDPPITPTAWTSFMTGLTPEIHGVYGFRSVTVKDSGLTFQLNNSASIRQRNIWQVLSSHGKHVCVLNLPLTYPPFKVNGILVSGFPCPTGRNSIYTHPADIQREILDLIPEYQPSNWSHGLDGMARGMEHFVERMIWRSRMRTQLSTHFLGRGEWDVFMVHYQETDFLQHRFWHCLDLEHPWFTETGFKTCAHFYRCLDDQLSHLCAMAHDRGYAILFMSDHGFQRCSYVVRINNWLVSQGYLCLHDGLKLKGIGLLKQLVKKAVPRQYLMKLTTPYLGSGIDPSRSLAYAETNSTNIAYAHFLTEHQEQRDRIIREISLISLPDGKRLVSEIKPLPGRDDTIKIILSEGVMGTGLTGAYGPWCSKIVLGKSPQIGVHQREGVLVADGSFEPAQLPGDIFGLFDFILDQQGIAEPTSEHSDAMSSGAISEAEQNQIEESLKALGYL